MFSTLFSCGRKSTSATFTSTEADSSASVINPMTLPAPETLDVLVQSLPRIKVGIITYNCGNENLPVEAVLQLKRSIEALDADILFFSFQEAKLSIRLGETLPQRILKSRQDSPQNYILLAEKNIYTPTHLNPFKHTVEAIKNVVNVARAKVAVAYKNTNLLSLNSQSLKAAPFKKHTPWNPLHLNLNLDNKGGMVSTLSFTDLDNFKINFIGAHLDSENYARGQSQAEALIELTQQEGTNSITFIAGDLNIRIAPQFIRETHSNSNAPLPQLLNAEKPSAIKGSITQWKAKPTLKRIQFAPVDDMTYCHTDNQDRVTYNDSRKSHDIGALDLAGYTRSPESRATAIHQPTPVTILEPKNIEDKVISDHKAVLTSYTVLPPITLEAKGRLNQLFRTTHLADIHRILEQANHPDLMRTYFEYAIAATTPNDTIIPYHLPETTEDRIVLIRQDITFIINHLDVLDDQIVNPTLYNRLIFETCASIAAGLPPDAANLFMHEKFQQLLNAPTRSGAFKLKLLSRFKNWLDSHQVQRERYTLNRSQIRELGFFAGNEPPPGLELTEAERVNLR